MDKLQNEGNLLALRILLVKPEQDTQGAQRLDEAMRHLILTLPKMDSKEKKASFSIMGVPEDRKEILPTTHLI